MTDSLTVLINRDSADTVTVKFGDRILGTTAFDDEGEFSIPLSFLADFGLRNTLTLAQNLADHDRADKEIWEAIDKKWPQAQSFCFEWYSEYDDEGGYYWTPSGASLEDGDGNEIETDYEFNDVLYEVGIAEAWYPDGEHKRPEA